LFRYVTLICVFCAALVLNISADTLTLSAESAVLIDAFDDTVLYEKNSEIKLPMASTTKIMTAVVALENSDLDKTVIVSEKAVGVEGSSIYLYPNEKIKMIDLVYALLLESANDAAAAIAIDIAGSIESFAVMMNNKAAELELSSTSFTNPHGLSDEEHYTTAIDLARLASYALKNDTFKKIVSTYKHTIPLNDGEGTRWLINHNKLLRQYDGAIGVKTGYTIKSGRCLVSAAERDGVTLVAVTLRAPDDWNDHTELLDYGFSVRKHTVLADAFEFRFELPVLGGTKSYVIAENTDGFTYNLNPENTNIRHSAELKRFYAAPISAGDIVGRIVFYNNDEVIGTLNIISSEDCPKREKSFFQKLIDFFIK